MEEEYIDPRRTEQLYQRALAKLREDGSLSNQNREILLRLGSTRMICTEIGWSPPSQEWSPNPSVF